jgi:pimeloyl-ACP methyl ester carboxylesterase
MTPGATWRIPNAAGTGTGTYQLASNECVFAYTPHASTPMYFGVVKDGTFGTTPTTRTGLIAQTTNPVQAHLQLSGSGSGGRTYGVYAHWVDGSDNDADQRGDYPLMADADWNGTARVFAVWDAPNGTPPANSPAIIALHGGNGTYRGFEPGAAAEFDGITSATDTWLILPEDNLHARGPSNSVQVLQTFWVGWSTGYNRFGWGATTPAGALIIPYTLRRVDWMRDWLTTQLALDPQRIAITGHSMGGQGCGIHARYRPAKYCGVIQHNPGLQPPDSQIFLGERLDNNPVKLPGNPGTQDVFNPAVRLDTSVRDLPLTKIVIGKNDTLPNAGWSSQKVVVFNMLAASGFGQHLFWDERQHGIWTGGHWDGSPRIRCPDVLRFRANQTFPALFNDDQNAALAGRQPDPGDGTPTNGDPWGTWSGYYDWESTSLADTTNLWAATMYLTGSSTFADDVPSFSSATASVALRRTQQFAPAPGTLLLWSLRRLTDNVVLQNGTVTVAADGLVSIPNLTLFKDPTRCRLEVRVPTAWTVSDLRLGSGTVSYIDSEFAPGAAGNGMGDTRTVFFDGALKVWIGNVSPDTGLFTTSTGQEQQLGTGSLFGSQMVNGPEWGLDSGGSAVFFTGADSNGIGQIFRASPPFDAPVLTQLTSTTEGYVHAIANATWNASRNTTLLMGFRGKQLGTSMAWQPGTVTPFWMDEAVPNVIHALPFPNLLHRWIPGTFQSCFASPVTTGQFSAGQIYLFDADTETFRTVSNDAGSKVSPWGFYAPEFGGEMLIMAVVETNALAIYRDLSGGTAAWTRIATLTLPAGTVFTRLTSAEPVIGSRGVGGASLFTVEAQTPSNDDSSIWLLGLTLDATPNFARRVDDGAVTGAKALRRDPETFFGDDELLVYYSVQGSPSQMRTARTGIYHRAPAVGFTRNGAQYELTLPTKSGATYQLQRSPDLTGWQPLGSPFLGDSFDETLLITPTARPKEFYRVSIKP